MTDRLTALIAAVLLAVTLAACGEADSKRPGTAPDTTPNGGITTQPDTNGTDGGGTIGDAGDSMNGGHNESGRADEPDDANAPGDARRYDRALAASMYQLIVNRLDA